MSKQIFSKIAKIGEEVRSINKIEFAAQDLRPNADKINSAILDMGFFNELQRVESAMSTSIKKSMSLRDLVAKNLNEFEAAVKELGINPSESENYKFATRELRLLDSNIADARKRLAALESAMGS
jgi:hypothetical protein